MNCPHFKSCGNCRYPLEDYEASLQQKTDKIRKVLEPFTVGEVTPTVTPLHYRHKAIFHFAQKEGKLIAGFHPEGSGKVFPLSDCPLQAGSACKVLEDLLPILRRHKLTAYDPLSRRGCLRHLLIRVSREGKLLLCFVTGSREFYSSKEIIKEIRTLHPEIIGVDHCVNPRNTSVVIEGIVRPLYGKGFLHDELGGNTYHIASASFYQVDPRMAEKIYGRALERLQLSGKEKVADAYCGNGTISLLAAKQAKEVTGIEINPASVAGAKESALRNDVQNVRFVCADAPEYLMKHSFEALIVDPPRAGLTKELCTSLLKNGPQRIAYISCDPSTLARDLKVLQKAYKVGKVDLFDQFAYTDHLEAVVLLSRRS
ncbi:MAG: 23S rRNA (uracil(1939)-C(5))-methyltransferase RlmD [Erysipelotrichaceae bacterium]|nr:23S rRNA (uracil(1939)-C(5))-methyltransferase RlmD [Erysipelotrichaceae bacterium]